MIKRNISADEGHSHIHCLSQVETLGFTQWVVDDSLCVLVVRWILSSKREAQFNAKQIVLTMIPLESDIVQDGLTHTPGIEGRARKGDLLTHI